MAGGSAALIVGILPSLVPDGVGRGLVVGGGAVVVGGVVAWWVRHHHRRLRTEAEASRAQHEALQRRVDELAKQLREADERVAAGEENAVWLRELEARLVAQQSTWLLGRMTGGVAHSFNNMLGGIMGYASAVEEVPDLSVTELRHYLSQISSSSQRATLLCHQLWVASSRPTSGDDVVHLDRFRHEVVPLLTACIGSGGTLTVDVERGLPSARADIAGLQIALANLAFNALESFAGRSGEIALVVSKTSLGVTESGLPFGPDPGERGEYLRFALTDNGAGVEESVRAQILQPFFTTKQDHLGLGLTAVDRWVRARKGALVVRPNRAVGTVVELYIPAAPMVMSSSSSRPPLPGLIPESSPVPAVASVKAGSLVAGRVGHVLVVDDDPTLREFSTTLLEHAGLTVVAVPDGRAALKLSGSGRSFDLALVDYQMPGLDGVETIAALRELDAATRYVLMSGSLPQEMSDLERAGELFGFLPKPFTPTMVRELLRKAFGELPGRR